MVRILSDTCLSGAEHMALDESLLGGSCGPTIRLYTWRQATLSLGYFQDHDAIASQVPADMPIVRRITGGGAIWHEHEITYALVTPQGTVLPERSDDCYAILHHTIAQALAERGANLTLQTRPSGDRRYRSEPRCFASPAINDLMVGMGKVLGSAGRNRDRRLLIHGSLKLASNPWDGPVTAGCGLVAQDAREALREALVKALGGDAQAGQLSAAEHTAWQQTLALRYDDPGWVERRSGPRP